MQTNSSCRSHRLSICLPPLLLLVLHVPLSDKVLAETDRLEMSRFVAVTTNSVSSWAILPVMVLASTPKTGTVILGGLFFFLDVHVGCLLLVVRAWLTNVINIILSFYLTGKGSILFSCFGLSAHASSVRDSEVRFSL